ncbi:hypothetical protein SABIM44S_03962 [Streptomyces abikoensis]
MLSQVAVVALPSMDQSLEANLQAFFTFGPTVKLFHFR